jgi:NIMA-interacting peptidyl-prolyl cis-trans isomerase 4
MIGAFQEVAFALEPGTMSEPFRTSEGYHIVLVEGRRN